MAKTKEALASLSAQFHNHNVRKSYAVLLFGSLKESTTVDMNLRRKPARKNLMGVTTKEGEGKSAITHFDPIHVYDWQGTPLTFCQCRIETGRTHQIRVHAKYLGHAVIGDPLYSSRPSEKVSKSLRVSRQMLHAHTLCIRHPQTKEEITFEAPLPDDFQSLLERLPEASSLC
jgi:23S rRNA pseudouridine1911/1915/1917 synthase